MTKNTNLKIQILAGNTLMSRFHVGFDIELPLGYVCDDDTTHLLHASCEWSRWGVQVELTAQIYY